jgi:H/ACA ribonucleoprotein complex non-core subunit NAF1
MAAVEIGAIHAVVDNTVVVEANSSGDYQVLDQDTIFILEDRTIVGKVP